MDKFSTIFEEGISWYTKLKGSLWLPIHFDGLSYFGGVLTTCGIVVIAFVGLKLYLRRKPKTENYELM